MCVTVMLCGGKLPWFSTCSLCTLKTSPILLLHNILVYLSHGIVCAWSGASIVNCVWFRLYPTQRYCALRGWERPQWIACQLERAGQVAVVSSSGSFKANIKLMAWRQTTDVGGLKGCIQCSNCVLCSWWLQGLHTTFCAVGGFERCIPTFCAVGGFKGCLQRPNCVLCSWKLPWPSRVWKTCFKEIVCSSAKGMLLKNLCSSKVDIKHFHCTLLLT